MPENKTASNGLIPPSLGIYSEEATQSVDLGTRVEMDDGSVFRYVGCDGTGIGVGLLVQYGGTVLDIEASSYVVSVATYNGTDAQKSIIELGTGTLTANAYAGGFIVIDSSTGAGQRRKIKSNTTTQIVLYDALNTAVSATSHAHLIPNPYNDVKLSTASGASIGLILGVTVGALTADYYGWIQTRGWAAVKDTATPAIGIPLIQGTTAGNTLELAETTFGQQVGVPPYTFGTNADFGLVYLQCE
tara:strand:+ start:44 stop:778 length:735 start_codon:yes stop_codon:yes gene_type:complete